jgi:hypothetical protein
LPSVVSVLKLLNMLDTPTTILPASPRHGLALDLRARNREALRSFGVLSFESYQLTVALAEEARARRAS